MSFLRSFLGRRQFLVSLISAAFALALGRISKILGLLFQDRYAEASERSKSPEAGTLRAIVVYYSATGSTGKIAGAIYRGMRKVMDCAIAPLKKISPKEIGKYDVVAIGGPIWYYRETANLRLFIYNMPRMPGKLFIPFCSHGASPEGFFHSLIGKLREKEFTVIGWNDWYGDVTHVLHMFQPYTTCGHPDEIDLKEAEAFGEEMAQRAVRIHAGERNLIPEIPEGPEADPLWQKESIEWPKRPGEYPKIDTAKCVYPRCTACMDNCPVDAINFMITPAASVSGSSIFVTGCLQCGNPLCQRSCSYDALTFGQGITRHIINMTRCTYPECTLCIDNCPMNSIDFSQSPPFFHTNCEGCDVCWCICPEDAVEIPNLDTRHGGEMEDIPFIDKLEKAIASGKFRPLIPLDELRLNENQVYTKPAPRIVLKSENYPLKFRS